MNRSIVIVRWRILFWKIVFLESLGHSYKLFNLFLFFFSIAIFSQIRQENIIILYRGSLKNRISVSFCKNIFLPEKVPVQILNHSEDHHRNKRKSKINFIRTSIGCPRKIYFSVLQCRKQEELKHKIKETCWEQL